MTCTRPEPRRLDSENMRKIARAIRERQWELAERAQKHDPVWFCVWNKAAKPELRDEIRCGLIEGMELLQWMDVQHPEWFEKGEWSTERYAFPVRLTEAGRRALTNRGAYDMEPVFGGLVEPGWQAIPFPSGGAP